MVRANLAVRLTPLAGAAIAIGLPAWQALNRFGMSAAEFSATGDTTLKAATWAFAIWGVIYTWLCLYALAQLFLRWSAGLSALAVPAALAMAGCGVWILVSSLNLRWLSVAVIALSLAAAVWGAARAARSELRPVERWLALYPVALLAGWLTAATALNILTVLTAEHLITGDGTIAAVAGIGATTLAGIGVQRTVRAPTYGLALTWGLIGVAVAEWPLAPVKAMAAGAGALVMLLSTALSARRP